MGDPAGRRRVVVTGLGAVSPLGASLASYWQGLIEGRSGIRRITQFDPGICLARSQEKSPISIRKIILTARRRAGSLEPARSD